jgi:D-glycero-alpha-D-manno-heptose 1-phosphate guanylyltransferase
LEVLILAGGLGTRLRPVVSGVPKPMASVSGRPFLEYILDYWIEQGATSFRLSVGYLGKVIENHFKSSYRGIDIQYFSETSPLGTGGGILNSIDGITESFLIVNGDTFFEVILEDLKVFHEENRAAISFSMFMTSNKKRFLGLKTDGIGKIICLNADQSSKSFYANGGVYLLNPNVLDSFLPRRGIRLSFENEILPSLLKSGAEMYGKLFPGSFIDIGVPSDYLQVSSILKGEL